MTSAAITAVLGGDKVFRSKRDRSSDLTTLTREGVPVSAFLEVAEKLNVDRKRLAGILGISNRTLSRRLANEQRLAPDESDRVVRLARLVSHTIQTLGTLDKASHWLQRPNRALGGEVPLELLDTDAGACEVDTVLGRIEYGLYS